MPIVHIVLFKIKADASEAAIANMGKELLALQAAFPDLITRASFGKSFTDRHKGFEYAFVTEMASREALATYSPHPTHQRVVQEVIKPLIDDIMAIDYDL
ncbi:hypothetical protein H9P43_008751 [Blastocladiella emersonii ATCC 22665]|nr:hypothetical protein H9P43_008751 [Blastocladiella emersonii ATCC 22665]